MTPRRGHVFISYSRDDDEPFVERLHAELEAAGIAVWWDRASMDSRGRHFLQEIQEAIQTCDRLIAVIGPGAFRSAYVRYEWEHALLFARTVMPILRIGCHEDFAATAEVGESLGLSLDLLQLHWTDFRPERDHAEALAELLRQIERPVGPLGPLHGVPPLPPHFLPRREPLKALVDGLTRDISTPCVITSSQQTSALQGMDGIGKSVLAAAVGRSAQMRRAFPDGIFWLPMPRDEGNDGRLEAMRRLGAALGSEVSTYGDPKSAASELERLLADRRCLLILDDVWHASSVETFRNVAGPAVRLLATTRIASLVSDVGARVHELDVLSDEQSLQLLASWMDRAVGDVPAEVDKLVAACGNLPLALSMIGAILRSNPDRVAYVLDRFANAELGRIERRLPNYGHPNLLRSRRSASRHWTRGRRRHI